MSRDRISRVMLLNSVTGDTQEFEFAHAERLLNFPDNGGWTLPPNSPFTQDEHGNIIKRDKREVKRPD